MIGGSFTTGYVSGNDYDDSRAPWNDTRDERVCEACDGDGRWYAGHRNETITEDEYNALPQHKREDYVLVICPECDGEGYVYE